MAEVDLGVVSLLEYDTRFMPKNDPNVQPSITMTSWVPKPYRLTGIIFDNVVDLHPFNEILLEHQRSRYE